MNADDKADHKTDQKADENPDDSRFVGHALIVAFLTLISRVTGLLRDRVLAGVFGLSAVADAFSLGFLIPNLFRRLFGEGALTAAFIPIYTDLIKKDRLTAKRLASLCIALMVVVLSALTLIGELILWWMLEQDLSADTHLAIKLTMIMLPYMPMICIVAMLGGILHVHGRFGPSAAAPILLNVVMIVAGLVATYGLTEEEHIRQAVPTIAAAVLIAGVLQLIWQVVAVLRFESFTRVFTGASPAFKKMMIMMLPMLIGLAVFQINTLTDSLIAFFLSPKAGGPEQLTLFGQTMNYPIPQQGSVAALQWSQRLYQFPLGVFGIAIATAIFPALAHAASSDSTDSKAQVRTIFQKGLRLTFFIGLPASVGLMLVRVPLSRVIYENGAFGAEDSLRVASILIGYASAVWAYSMTHVITRAFYAMKDSKTPLKVSLCMVAANLALNLALIWPMGVAGLAWSSAICAAGQVVFLLIALRRHIDQPVDQQVLNSWKRSAILSAIMAGALLPIVMLWDASEISYAAAGLQLIILVLVGAGVIVTGAIVSKNAELGWLLRRRIN